MKEKKKGVLQILSILVVLAVLGAYLVIGWMYDDVKGVKDVSLGLDLDGGLSIVYETAESNPDSDKLDITIYRMQQRVENYSTESQVYKQGDNRICVEIPGVTNAEQILGELGDSGNVYFIIGKGEDGVENLRRDEKGDYILTRDIEEIIAAGACVLDGSDVANAEAMYREGNGNNQTTGISYYVELTLKDASKSKFYEATKACAAYYYTPEGTEDYFKGTLAIIYDNDVISAPRCQEAIDSATATITGNFSLSESKNLANTIKIGALPLKLHQLQYSIVGAQLGTNALETILLAGFIGLILVMIFMIVMYKLPGIVSTISLIIYTALLLICLFVFNITLTLPGIAGIILSIGMAVDANVIIFTRIREELRAGKTVRSAIKLGFSKALSAIVDGNVTTLIAAFVLYLRGSGTIRGFAITLALGIILSMISALLICRFIIYAFYNIGFKNEKFYGIAKPTKIINFTKHWVKYVIVSGVLIVTGLVALVINNANSGRILNYGLDFVGGTAVEVYFDQTPPSNADIEAVASKVLSGTPQVVQVDGENAVIIKTDEMIVEGSEGDSAATENNQITKLKEALKEAYGVDSSKIQVDSISAAVSDEMKADAIWAVIIAGICMLLYIWFRFSNLAFAGSAVLALLHDVLVVLMIYAVFKVTVDNSFIACMLTIVGYSINATIVIFDRIRENLKARTKKDTLDDVVNKSVSETLSRSINTSLTTMFSILMIIFLGVDTIRSFAIPLFVGLVCGTYSSVCITGTLWLFFQKKVRKAQ